MSSGTQPASAFDHASFRAVLGHFATGVVVVTASDNGVPVGMTCNSFTSVSLDPPMVLFCAAKSSSTWPRIQSAGRFAVNFLDDDGEEICRLFAQKDADRFARISHRAGRSGSPVLDDALAFVECETAAEHEAGDHVIVVGRAIELGSRSEGKPLVFFRGGYGRFEN